MSGFETEHGEAGRSFIAAFMADHDPEAVVRLSIRSVMSNLG